MPMNKENPAASERGFLFEGQSSSQQTLMGIVNVTPDSFSDGGDFSDTEKAVAQGLKLWEEGAHILDVGGESTRPGAVPVSPQEEEQRVVPVIRELASKGAVVSVDSRNAATMSAALEAGAVIVNDVTALTHDPDALSVVSNSKASVVLMHMVGSPGTMQQEPYYENVVEEVYGYLEERVKACVEAGIEKNRIAIDPGIGFGKNDDHNLALLKNLSGFKNIGCAILIGISRKSMIGRIAGIDGPKNREPGTIALNIAAYQQGAKIFRVHDVAAAKQALTLWNSVTK
ncbi:MAG: dihydropteroate synthase [Rhodospirillales bacterium]|nr:dihydropteroate synthase [Rhodospirillales bacterium]